MILVARRTSLGLIFTCLLLLLATALFINTPTVMAVYISPQAGERVHEVYRGWQSAALATEEAGAVLRQYEVLYPTTVHNEPRESSRGVARIEAGTTVNVVGVKGEWLEIRSKYGRSPGFIKKDFAKPIVSGSAAGKPESFSGEFSQTILAERKRPATEGRHPEKCATPTRADNPPGFKYEILDPKLAALYRKSRVILSADIDPRLSRAWLLEEQGLVDDAYAIRLDVLCEWPDANSKAFILQSLSKNRWRASSLEDAIWFYEKYLVTDQMRTVRKMGPRTGTQTIVDHLQIGAWYARLGDIGKAKEEISRAVLILNSPQSRDIEKTFPNVYLRIAALLVETGDISRSQHFLKMWEQRTKQNVSSLVPDWTLIELGGAYLRAGKYDEAKELVVPALKSLERTSQDADKVGTLMESLRILADVSIAQENGAAALRYLKDYEATKALHQQLLKVAMKRERANAPEVGRTFSEFDRAWTESVNYAERASTASSFGKAYSLTGQHLEAATKFLDAVEIIENLRGFLGFEDRLNFFGKYTSPYHLLVDSLLRLDGKDQGLVLKRFPGKGRSSAEIAFYFAESARARLLSERIARSSAGGLGGKISPEILRIEREHLNTATAELRGGIPFQESPAYRRFQSFIEDIRKTYPDYTTLKYPAPVTSSEVPLREKETLLVYAVLRQSVAVWLLQRAKEPRVFQIPVAQDRLLKTISAIRASLEPQSDKRLPPFDFRASGELYQWLLAEPLKSVSRGSTIIVIPDSALGTIPFEALSVRRRDGTIEFMGEHYTFSYTPSATVLTYKRKISSPARTPIRGVRILAVGDPVYEEADPRLAKSPPVNETMLRARRAALRAYWRNRGFSRLPGTNQRSKP